MEVMELHRSLSASYPRVCQVGKILAAGGMLGTALLFPIAQADGLPFLALTLTIFTVCLVVFHALHLEPFVRFGPYTSLVALFVLLLVVLPGGPSNKRDIIPWLPLYVVFACLLTAAIHEIPFRITRSQSSVIAQAYDSSYFASPRTPDRTPSEWSDPRAPSQSYRNDPNSFQHMGPRSSRSVQTGSGATEYTLSGDLDGARRDPHMAFIYGDSHIDPGRISSEDVSSASTRAADAYAAAPGMELGRIRPSQDSAQDSRAPFLGSYD